MQTGVAQSKMFSQCASRKQEVVVALRMKPAMGRPVVLYTCRPRTALFVTTGRFLQKFSAKRRRRSSSEASVGVVDAQMRPGDPSDSGSLDQPAARNEAPREPSTSVPCVTLRCVNSDVISERERFRAVQGSLAQPAARNEAPRDSNTSSHMSTTIATPTRSSEAIERGLECFAQQDYETAIDYFTQSLELPGNGFVRSPDSPREYACPSEGEERAALYNMACCYAKLGEVDSGMAVLRGLLENGFEDLDTLRNDEDVEGLRSSPEFEQLLVEASSAQKPGLFGQKKRKGSSSKGWLDRW